MQLKAKLKNILYFILFHVNWNTKFDFKFLIIKNVFDTPASRKIENRYINSLFWNLKSSQIQDITITSDYFYITLDDHTDIIYRFETNKVNLYWLKKVKSNNENIYNNYQ